MGSELTTSYIRSYVKRQLGVSSMQVEISDDDIDQAAANALRLFRRHLYYEVTYAEENVSDTVSVDIDSSALGVTYVAHVATTDIGAGMDIFTASARLLQDYGAGDLYERKLHTELWAEITGGQFEWHYDPVTNKLWLDAPGGPYHVSYRVAFAYASAAAIPTVYDQLYLDATEGFSRLILGEIRGKYPSIPGPMGEVQVDGEFQRSRGEAILEKVREDLQSIQPENVPMQG